MGALAYFSSVSGNTARFVAKLGLPAHRVPLRAMDAPLVMDEDFVLVVPTYGGGSGHGAVPKQVIRFLNDERNRSRLRGVIAGGNTNFGAAYGLAGDVIAAKCQVPCLYRFELFGTSRDVEQVRRGLALFWAPESGGTPAAPPSAQ